MRKSIKNWSEQDRPREKLLSRGVGALTDAEVMAILLNSGNKKQSAVELARDILESYNSDLAKLSRCTIDELKTFSGVGEAKAVTLIAALELGRRRKEIRQELYRIGSSKDVAGLMQPLLSDLAHEEFWVIFLNRANQVIDKYALSSGGTAGTVIDVKIILKSALNKLSEAIILSHNHPSGNKEPSRHDISITEKLKKAASYMDIRVLDHVIIAGNDYYSFADEGVLSSESPHKSTIREYKSKYKA